MRQTKIVVSLGPSTDDPVVLRSLVRAGMNVARINLSHGSIDDGMVRYRAVRAAAEEEGIHVGVLADLPGPKVRAAAFSEKSEFETGDTVRLEVGNQASGREVIEIDYEDLRASVHVGDRLNIGDGRLVLQIQSNDEDKLIGEVVHGGTLSGNPGVHIPADRLQMSTPTPYDLKLVDAFVEVGVDMLAVSFVRSAHDMRRIGTEPIPRGPLLVAKIETRAAVENLDGIIAASGAVMVARGDLGNELPLEDLPITQKTDHKEVYCRWEAGDHRNPDARIDDYRAGSDPRRGIRRGQCGLGRLERNHAVGRNRSRDRPDQRCSYDGTHRS